MEFKIRPTILPIMTAVPTEPVLLSPPSAYVEQPALVDYYHASLIS